MQNGLKRLVKSQKSQESKQNKEVFRQKRRRTGEVEGIGRVEPESTPRRKKRSRHRRHRFRPLLWPLNLSITTSAMVEVLCWRRCRRRQRRRLASRMPKGTEPEKLHIRVRLMPPPLLLVVHDGHALRRNLRHVATSRNPIRARLYWITKNSRFSESAILCSLWTAFGSSEKKRKRKISEIWNRKVETEALAVMERLIFHGSWLGFRVPFVFERKEKWKKWMSFRKLRVYISTGIKATCRWGHFL